MDAVIMAGGEGTRLRPLTYFRPKPMVPVARKPIIHHLIDILVNHRFNRCILTVGYLWKTIQHYFENVAPPIHIDYSVEEEPLGTAGSVKKALLEKDINDTFLVLSGDILVNIDLDGLLDFHRQKGGIGTIVFKRITNPTHYGIGLFDENQRLLKYREKPPKEQAFSNLGNAGIYVFEPEILDYIENHELIDFSKDVFPRALAANEQLYGYELEGYWKDIGRPETYLKVNHDALTGKVKLDFGNEMKKEEIDGETVWIGKDSEISDGSQLKGPVMFGHNVTIGEDCMLRGPAIVGSGAIIKKDAMVNKAMVFSNTNIGMSSLLQRCIVGAQCRIGLGARIRSNAVVGDFHLVRKFAEIAENMKIWDHENNSLELLERNGWVIDQFE